MACHEAKACDAVIRVLEAREGTSRRDVRSPEKDGDPAPIARTVLILEDNDLQLTNAKRVFDVLTQEMIAGKPDEVHLVSTMISLWFVHALRIGDQTYYRLSELQQCMTQISPPPSLIDLTGR